MPDAAHAAAFETRPSESLDLTKVPCPLPPLQTVRALKRMKPGQILEVAVKGNMSRRRTPWLASKFGHEVLASFEDDSGVLHILFARS